MIGRSVLGTLDAWARTAVSPQVDPDILDLDSALWQLATSLAKSYPDMAKSVLGLSTELVETLSSLDACPDYLASGTFLSFAPVFSVTRFEKAYAAAQGQPSSSILSDRHIDIMYWQSLVRVAERRGASSAALVFGVSSDITHRIEALGFAGARTLAQYLDPSWALRYRSDLAVAAIQGYQGAENEHEARSLTAKGAMTRLAQALTHPRANK